MQKQKLLLLLYNYSGPRRACKLALQSSCSQEDHGSGHAVYLGGLLFPLPAPAETSLDKMVVYLLEFLQLRAKLSVALLFRVASVSEVLSSTG